MVLIEGEEIQIGYKEESLYEEVGEALKQVAQRSCGYPIPENVQDRVGWGFDRISEYLPNLAIQFWILNLSLETVDFVILFPSMLSKSQVKLMLQEPRTKIFFKVTQQIYAYYIHAYYIYASTVFGK